MTRGPSPRDPLSVGLFISSLLPPQRHLIRIPYLSALPRTCLSIPFLRPFLLFPSLFALPFVSPCPRLVSSRVPESEVLSLPVALSPLLGILFLVCIPLALSESVIVGRMNRCSAASLSPADPMAHRHRFQKVTRLRIVIPVL